MEHVEGAAFYIPHGGAPARGAPTGGLYGHEGQPPPTGFGG